MAIPTPTVLVSGFRAFATPPLESQSRTSPTGAGQSPVLWGMAALGAIGAATAYALGQRRKRKEEEARQAAEAAAEAARRNAAEEARKVRNWLQGKAMLEAQLREAEKAGASQEQIATLRQIGVTKGLGTALAATAVAIRLLVEKNRAQSEHSHLSASGDGKRWAFPVYRTDSGSFTLADSKLLTLWDKLKQLLRQLWDAFWNWMKNGMTGKPAMPIPTTMPVVTPTFSPILAFKATPAETPIITSTSTQTPIMTSTPSPSATPQILPISELGQRLQELARQAGLTHIQTCAIILKAEAGQAPIEDRSWFTGQRNDPAFLYQEAAARWFWSWGKWQGFDMENPFQRQAAMYDWLANGMESTRRRIDNNGFSKEDVVDERFLSICEGVFEPQVPEWRKGDGMWSWANDYLYDSYPKAQAYLRAHYRYKFGQGSTAWYIVDTDTLRMLDFLKRGKR